MDKRINVIEGPWITGWDHYFMEFAKVASLKSKDPSSKIGAVIVGPDKEIISTGFNGMPMGVNDYVTERREVRDVKLMYFEHAERNAIFLAARHGTATKGCSIYVSGLPPCAECCRAIIQAGITRVVVAGTDVPERWARSCEAGLQMLTEAGVGVDALIQ